MHDAIYKTDASTIKDIKNKCLNILTSNNELTDDKVVWFPERVDDISEFLMQVADEEPTQIIINDVLENISEENLIEGIYMKTLESRIEEYNKHFGFIENPEDFNFKMSPERMIYRNEALRTGNRDLYSGYLSDNYPNEMESELSDFDVKVDKIVKMDKDQIQAYMDEKGFNLLKGDLHLSDQDSIFYGVKVPNENVQWETEDNMDDLVNPIGHVGDAFFNKEWIWIAKE